MHLVNEESRGASVIRITRHGAAFVVGHGALFATISAVCLVWYLGPRWASGWYQMAFVEWFDYPIEFAARSALIALCTATAADATIRWCWREDARIRLQRTVVMGALGMLFVLAGNERELRMGVFPPEVSPAWQFVMPMLYGVAAAVLVSARMQLRNVGALLRRAA
jgi:hypothetical protein